VIGYDGMPTIDQLGSLYRLGYQLTYIMLQPVHMICVDDRTKNLYVLAGNTEELEFQIRPNGEFADEPDKL
jgi:hypothetical protein